MTISTDVDKLYDTDLTDAAWALIAPMLPAARPGGGLRPLFPNIRTVIAESIKILQHRWVGDDGGGVEVGDALAVQISAAFTARRQM